MKITYRIVWLLCFIAIAAHAADPEVQRDKIQQAYTEVHRESDKGYWEWSVGVSYKGFLINRFTKRAGS